MGIIPDCALRPLLSRMTWGKIRARSERGSTGRLNEKFNPKSLITTMRATSRLRYCESGYFRIGGEVVNKLRKHPDKSAERKAVPEDFEPEVIDETEEGECIIIIPARPPQKPQNRQ